MDSDEVRDEQPVNGEIEAEAEATFPEEDAPQVAEAEEEVRGEGEPELATPVLKGDQGIEKALAWFSAFLVVVVGVLTFSTSLAVPFQGAALDAITSEAPVEALTSRPEPGASIFDAPLTAFTYALNLGMARQSAVGFHVVDLALHLLTGVLVFLLCRRLAGPEVRDPVSMAAAMLFVVHPLNADSVNSILGRADILGGLFTVASVLLFVEAGGGERPARPWAVAGSVLCFVLAWLSSPVAYAVPVLILAADWVRGGARGVASRLALHASVWLTLPALLVAQYADAGSSGLAKPAGAALLDYVRLSIAPVGLSAVHTTGDAGHAAGIAAVGVAGVVGVILLAFRSMAGAGLVWFALCAVLAAAWGDGVSERHAYLGLAGLALIVPYLFSLIKKPFSVVLGIIVAAAIGGAIFQTYSQNMTWRDPVALWQEATERAPESARAAGWLGQAHLGRAEALLAQADTAFGRASVDPGPELGLAEASLRRASELDTLMAQPYVDLGRVLMYQGRKEEAIEAYERGLARDITNQPCTLQIASMLTPGADEIGDREKLARCLPYYARAEALGPLPDEVLEPYAMALFGFGDIERSQVVFERLAAKGMDKRLEPFLKSVQQTVKQLRALEEQARGLLAKDAHDPRGLELQAQALLARGRAVRASYILEELLAGGEAGFSAWLSLGNARASMQGWEHFIKEWPEVPGKPEKIESAWLELARSCAARGLWDAAEAYAQGEPARAEMKMGPFLALSDIALSVRQVGRAEGYLEKAKAANPEDSGLYLRLCDLAIVKRDGASAQAMLAEAEKRGAAGEELAKRRKVLGVPATPKGPAAGKEPAAPQKPASPQRMVIQ